MNHHDYTAAKSLPLSWEDIHRDTHRLADKISGLGPFKGIVAVARGGLVPACIMARILNLRLVETICIASYDDRTQGAVSVLKGLSEDGEGWLVVDDLVDSGVTAREIKKMMPKCHYATVYAKPQGRPDADTVVVDVGQDVWLVFPWDVDPADRRPA
ncbi:xanthine phosphoribosyltransferase [Telmatospirillum sp. J64-1]|uniref:xanthine phosphoribosyltransferase n=1 Tax=Telmatospirillum sp. J64-1 TaxID=2502183 RepID=UPI002105E4BB|nr:xanthine phosphoribosyltransferase [Telmatospirillum sp. J64-1]